MNTPRDQKLGDWLKVDLRFEFIRLSDIITEELKDPVQAFNNNVWHALHLSTLPIGMIDLGQKLVLAHLAACQHRLNDPCLVGYRQFSAEEFNDIRQLSRDILAGKIPTDVGIRNNMVFIQDLISLVSDKTIETYDTLMNSQLVLSWTAFETLAGDLWEGAINTHCPSLVSRAWKGKSVLFELLRDNDFNLRNKMGTVLRKHLENPFQSLKDIRKAYQDAFPEGWISEDDFWKNKNVSSTFHIRNLIVHRASIVDDKFREECKSDPRIDCPPVRDRFYLDGSLLTELLTGLFSVAKRVIQSVDGYISRNK
jgi:hypothetical protein